MHIVVATAINMTVLLALLGRANAAQEEIGPTADSCQKGGYRELTRSDGTRFATGDECMAYATRGGTLVPLVQDAQLLVQAFVSPSSSPPRRLLGGLEVRGTNFPGNVYVYVDVYLGPSQFKHRLLMLTDIDGSFHYGPFPYMYWCDEPGDHSFEVRVVTPDDSGRLLASGSAPSPCP